MLSLVAFIYASQVTAFSSPQNTDLVRRGVKRPVDCLSSSCDGPNSFEAKYELGVPIMKPSPVFKCSERETGTQYVCKFPRLKPLINKLPAEITVLETIKQSDGPQKDLFVQMHEYFHVEYELSTVPQVLKDSVYFKANLKEPFPEKLKIYVEVLDLYDAKWVDGFDYIHSSHVHRTEEHATTIFKKLVSGIHYLQSLGYSHGDINRNYHI